MCHIITLEQPEIYVIVFNSLSSEPIFRHPIYKTDNRLAEVCLVITLEQTEIYLVVFNSLSLELSFRHPI